MMLTYRMMAGPEAGHLTTDVEQYIRWLSKLVEVTPEHAQELRNAAAEGKANAETNRVIDAAAAKFEDRE
ncbi:hypothetical protein LCGC14_2450320 [marine sediment metagenome]|uniref:Uncharacterized protein n=1 Tax=marine sediment metagenome TaxID=412755 RepID=A0A0F9EA65_9ZZZZ